jgi:hypothetical protein
VNTRAIAFWATTAVLEFVLLSGGFGELTHQWSTPETVQILGYPAYVLTILGLAKLLGGVAILAPRVPSVLKEWAYAGVVFNMLGAAASHAFSSDFGPFAFHIVVPTLLAVLAVASSALRPRTSTSRTPVSDADGLAGFPSTLAVSPPAR